MKDMGTIIAGAAEFVVIVGCVKVAKGFVEFNATPAGLNKLEKFPYKAAGTAIGLALGLVTVGQLDRTGKMFFNAVKEGSKKHD